ncbi:GTP 3',8-cyclase MoaA [Ilyomonas limi]|uniref:GTP 3',8-cyclase n=1 Tax=Ilyomonas limi TaxID=2575867 RepID=A0A4U3LC70_9BACT|nr:GTP 3',8-cyclase MoaA [Ilyomonas limi]TKK71666.1 GTP 3',8-cyclase MoaA [Ilyomonas limi]
MKQALIDKYGRQLNYLRLSVTDRCNLRCYYCMPEEGMHFAQRKDLLNFEEMYMLTAVFCSLGVSKIRITGGEPFVRNGIMPFLENISTLEGLEEITITTNATLTGKYIQQLKAAGIRKINVSLDSLDRQRFYQITRRDSFDAVYNTVFALLNEGFEVKLNCVLSAAKNVNDIIPFIELTKAHPLSVRFLEEMPFNGSAAFDDINWNYKDIYNHISQHYDEVITLENSPTSTSLNYAIPGYKGTFGIIPSFSRTFCGTCNRIRLSATGELRTCLYGAPAANLRDVLRNGADEAAIREMILLAVSNRLKDGFAAERVNTKTVHDSMSVLGG